MKGFTLIELLVVIAIIAILVVVAVPSYNEYNRNQKLAEAVNQLQAVLRQAQNNAQTGTVCKIDSNTYKASSWKVTLNSDSYSVSPVCDLSAPPTPTPPAPTPSSQQYLLPTGVSISTVQIADSPDFNNPCTETLPVSIEYKNLSSEVIFNLLECNTGVNAVAEITLNLTGSTTSKIVRVEKGGGIYVKQ